MENTRKKPEKGKHRLHEEVVLPIDGLPLNIQDYINKVASVYQCPREFPTVAVFSAFSTTIGKRVKITDGKYTNPIMFWVVNVAPSGSKRRCRPGGRTAKRCARPSWPYRWTRVCPSRQPCLQHADVVGLSPGALADVPG